MKIYTRRGDQGQTDLFSGERVSKTDALVEAYGTVDELNALLGVIRSALTDEENEIESDVLRIQNELQAICAVLANTDTARQKIDLTEARIDLLEERCDFYQEKIPEIRYFVLPGGTKVASQLHHARTVCRRAERRVLAAEQNYRIDPLVIKYLNRLSDLLFLMARYYNYTNGEEEQKVQYE